MTRPTIQNPVVGGPIIRGPIIRGWCPGALRPMVSGDGLVVRVRPRGGRLTQAQAAGIAALARAHGNGLIDLSARANVQLRGVTETSHPPLIEGLRALGLIDANAEAEARRNIVVTPFWTQNDGTQDIAAGLADALAAENAPGLPGKFGFALDPGPQPTLQGIASDIRIERRGDALFVRADGSDTGAMANCVTVVDSCMALARWFATSGGIANGRGRMAAHIARGARLPEAFRHPAAPTAAAPAIMPHPVPGPLALGQLVGFEFGQMQAETLAALATLGALRVTPWRMLLIEGLADAPDLPGLITAPDDPMLRVIACTGAPGCPQALAPTRPLARSLAVHVPQGAVLHVSGCAKGCALPGPAPFVLLAQTGGYGLICNGTASATAAPALCADTLLKHASTLFETP
ncbi:MAG: precorrin-3B synthase [Paracoccaceae bacterium]|nr:precorrin-3B synthase [Paracoccaceae bacterium]